MTTTIYYGPEAPADLDARCPICGRLCDILLLDSAGDIVGCDCCAHDQDVTDYAVATNQDYLTARCPICGSLCDTITRNESGEVLGCDCCLSEQDAYDHALEEHAAYMEWLRETAMGGDYYE